MESSVSSSATHPTTRANVPAARHPRTAACPHRQLIHDTLMYVCTVLPCNRHGSRRPARPRQPLHGATSFAVACAAVNLARPWQGIPFSFPPPPHHRPPWAHSHGIVQRREIALDLRPGHAPLSSIGTRPDGAPILACLHVAIYKRRVPRRTAAAAHAVAIQVGSIPYLHVGTYLWQWKTRDKPSMYIHQRSGLTDGDIDTASIWDYYPAYVTYAPAARVEGCQWSQQE